MVALLVRRVCVCVCVHACVCGFFLLRFCLCCGFVYLTLFCYIDIVVLCWKFRLLTLVSCH